MTPRQLRDAAGVRKWCHLSMLINWHYSEVAKPFKH